MPTERVPEPRKTKGASHIAVFSQWISDSVTWGLLSCVVYRQIHHLFPGFRVSRAELTKADLCDGSIWYRAYVCGFYRLTYSYRSVVCYISSPVYLTAVVFLTMLVKRANYNMVATICLVSTHKLHRLDKSDYCDGLNHIDIDGYALAATILNSYTITDC
jgi:hypothetical protein